MDIKKIYITRKIPEEGIVLLKEKGYEVDIGETSDAPSKEMLIGSLKAKPYDALICFLTDTIERDVFDACPTIRIVATYSVGFNNIDCALAKERGIEVTNTPGTSSTAVAEHTVALMMALTTRTIEGDRFMRKGLYSGWSPYLFIGTDLSKKTIGLIGSGAIGKEVARMLSRGFDCSLLYYDVAKNNALEDEYGARFTSLEDIFRDADIVSLHVPLLESTKHLVNSERLSLMKKDAFLINTARGPIVDEEALVLALREGKIRGAALDVFEYEPFLTKGLDELENVILTPHIASSRESVRIAMAISVANNVISFFETGKALNSVHSSSV